MTDHTTTSAEAPTPAPAPERSRAGALACIPPAPSGAARFATLGLSIVLAVSVLPVLWLTVVQADATLWFSTVFEVLVLGAAVFGVFSGLGRFREGWALSLACVAGTVLVCGVFAFVEIRANFAGDAAIAGLLKPYLAFRLALAAALAGVASLTVFSRNQVSWKFLLWGVAILAPALGVLAWVGTSGRLSTSQATPGAEAVRILALCLGGLVVVVMVSIGLHLLIRAYEMGRTPDQLAAEGSDASKG